MQHDVSSSDSKQSIHEKLEELNALCGLEKYEWLHLLVEFMEAQLKGLQGDAYYESIRYRLATDPEAQRIFAKLMAMELNDSAQSSVTDEATPPRFDLRFLSPIPPGTVPKI